MPHRLLPDPGAHQPVRPLNPAAQFVGDRPRFRSVADDARSDQHQQLAFGHCIVFTSEQRSQDRNIACTRYFSAGRVSAFVTAP